MHFCWWYPMWDAEKQVWTKIPCDVNGIPIDVTNPANFMTWEQVSQSDLQKAFIFTETDPYFFIDIDKCLVDGQWSPVAQQICRRFAGCYIEISHSGNGLHVIGQYSAIADHRCKNRDHKIELYHAARFCALTGSGAVGNWNVDATAALHQTINEYFTPSNVDPNACYEWTTEPREDARPIADDLDLIKIASKSKSAGGIFGGKATFDDLWIANEKKLAEVFPSSTGDVYDRSSADAALAQHLAFWTGCNCERIRKLMNMSALTREKWERDDYMHATITGACARQKDVFKTADISVPEPTISPEQLDGFQYLHGEQQAKLFAGCVYITELNRILTPKAKFLKSEQFNATYGGYTFAIDNDKKITRKAWDAFTESQLVRFPKVDSAEFDPRKPFCEISQKGGMSAVNIYRDPCTVRKPGDVSPFLKHLEKVLPVPDDQEILLSYMAAVVQHKGEKFQWAPLLQGVEGNGKSLFSYCLIEALGDQYAFMPKAKQIDSPFNGWLLNKIFIGVEDIYVPGAKMDMLETLKPMITGSRQEIQMKGVDQFMAKICANFIFNSNHKDAIKKTINDRRFAVFFTAQQSAADLERDGMDGGYFPELYKWLKDRGGYAAVHDFLATYSIPPSRNPADACHRAPRTSSYFDAIEASLSPLEARLQECIDDELPGFRDGFVALSAAQLRCADLKVTPKSFAAALGALGYVRYQQTARGQFRIGEGRTILYARAGHPATGLPPELFKIAYLEQNSK